MGACNSFGVNNEVGGPVIYIINIISWKTRLKSPSCHCGKCDPIFSLGLGFESCSPLVFPCFFPSSSIFIFFLQKLSADLFLSFFDSLCPIFTMNSMDPDQLPPPNPRKVRFAPKARPRRTPKPAADPKTEIVDEDTGDDEEAVLSLRRLVKDRLGKRGPKVEKKPSVQVAFAHGSSSATIRSYGVPREGNSSKINGLGSRDSAVDDEQILFSLPSTGEPYGTSGISENALVATSRKIEKDYREPWDYHHSDYPITLPLRRPYSGDPELLDEAEFGDAADNLEYDENTINSALELGLMEETDKPQMLFLQFPPNLPLPKRSAGADGNESKGASASAKGKEIAGNSKSRGSTGASAAVKGKEIMSSSPMPLERGNASKMHCGLEGLPGGYMGKMLVYKSGAIKWKLGNVVYDVSYISSVPFNFCTCRIICFVALIVICDEYQEL
ncbi:uncharacterized protein LOC131319488 isoform X3 [Rhododendron vialii]|uniref:uncharacterized protein LOC131319488 isoform X3 n=1 Tax=Rhododendron vialii TaxID=182163 RepID=UPI00265F81A6|nr:uncharacterized protein LOC131319488 isoform X3 [Rhododendron vialii]